MAKGAPDYSPWSGQKRMNATGGATAFEQTITLPKNTPIGAPVPVDIVMSKGFVTSVEIILPPGCAGLVGIRINDIAVQLFPGTAGTWFTGDNSDIYLDTDYDVPLVGGIYRLTIWGYNLDDTYQHTPIIRMWVTAYP